MSERAKRPRDGYTVIATEKAYRNGVFRPDEQPVVGFVVGTARDPDFVRVRRKGRKTVDRYHRSFWKVAAMEEGATDG